MIIRVPKDSAWFYEKIAHDMHERLKEIDVIYNLVVISPRDMILLGRYDKLRRFIMEARQNDRPSD